MDFLDKYTDLIPEEECQVWLIEQILGNRIKEIKE